MPTLTVPAVKVPIAKIEVTVLKEAMLVATPALVPATVSDRAPSLASVPTIWKDTACGPQLGPTWGST